MRMEPATVCRITPNAEPGCESAQHEPNDHIRQPRAQADTPHIPRRLAIAAPDPAGLDGSQRNLVARAAARRPGASLPCRHGGAGWRICPVRPAPAVAAVMREAPALLASQRGTDATIFPPVAPLLGWASLRGWVLRPHARPLHHAARRRLAASPAPQKPQTTPSFTQSEMTWLQNFR